jgi:hypothetical protein
MRLVDIIRDAFADAKGQVCDWPVTVRNDSCGGNWACDSNCGCPQVRCGESLPCEVHGVVPYRESGITGVFHWMASR